MDGRGRLRTVIAGIGVDIVEIARLEAALRRTPELASRLFTEAERSALGERRAPAARAVSLAGCFAAKEALAKVLGAPAGLRWTDAEVARDPAGRPFLHVRGTVAAAARRQGIGTWHLSLSHDGGLCVAMVVAERGGDPAGADGGEQSARSGGKGARSGEPSTRSGGKGTRSSGGPPGRARDRRSGRAAR